MKSFLMAVILMFSGFVSAQTASGGPCIIQTKTEKERLQQVQRFSPATYLLGQVKGLLLGDLHPVLGEGGLVAVTASSGSLILFQKGEDAPAVSYIKENAELGKKLIGIDTTCIDALISSKSADRKYIAQMKRIAEKTLKAKQPYSYFMFLY